jgi:hypothetical protein
MSRRRRKKTTTPSPNFTYVYADDANTDVDEMEQNMSDDENLNTDTSDGSGSEIIPPVFAETEIDEDPPQDESTASGMPEPKTRRPPRRPRVETQQSNVNANANTNVRIVKPYTEDDADFDTWASKFEWDKPGMWMKLERLSPTHYAGQLVGGFLGKSLGKPFQQVEILDQWGGGEFRASVIGPALDERRGKETLRIIGHKKFSISGNPIPSGADMNPDGTPIQQQSNQRGGRMVFNQPPNQQQVVREDPYARILSENMRHFQTQASRGGQNELATLDMIKNNCDDTVANIRGSEQARADSAVRAADMRANEARAREAEVVKEKQRLEIELRERERTMLEDRAKADREIAERVAKAQGSGNELLVALLPQASRDATMQVQSITQLYENRLAASETAHQNALAQIERNYAMQIKSMEMSYDTRLEHARQDTKNSVSLLEKQLEILRAERDAYVRSLEDSRRETQKARDELMTQVVSAKTPKSAQEQMGEMAALFEGVQSIKGVLGGGETPAEGEGEMSVMGLANKFLSIVPQVLEARAASQGAPPQSGQGPMYSQEQVQQILAQQQAAISAQVQAQVAQQPRRLAQPRPPAQDESVVASKPIKLPKLSREAVAPAIDFLNTVISTAGHPSPDETAQGAMNVIQDRGMLRALAFRDPDKLVVEFINKGLITQEMPLFTGEGQAFLKELLLSLRVRLGPPPTT